MDEKEKTTEEKLKELEEKLAQLTTTTAETISNLTAERDANKQMLDDAQSKNKQLEKDLQETKKMNFILASQKDAKPKQSFEDALLGMMGVKKNDTE